MRLKERLNNSLNLLMRQLITSISFFRKINKLFYRYRIILINSKRKLLKILILEFKKIKIVLIIQIGLLLHSQTRLWIVILVFKRK